MKLNLKYLSVVLIGGTLVFSSCTKHPDSPGYEYMPDMYRSQAIEAYVDYGLVGDDERDERSQRLKNTQSARTPVEGTIPFNSNPKMAELMMPLPYGPNDLDSAAVNLKIPAFYLEDIDGNVAQGKRLYNIFCKHCHGEKGMGDGGVVTVGDFNTPSPYNAGYKDRTPGGIFHVITHGKGAMGSHASQIDKDERWKVTMYVRTLQHGKFLDVDQSGSVTEEETTVSTEAGEALFSSLGCVACHQATEKTVGPSLADVANAYAGNLEALSSFLKGEGDAIVDPALFSVMESQLAFTKDLSDTDLNELVNYINNIK